MRAMVYHKYGPPDVLKLMKIEMPIAEDNEVLIRVTAASVNWLDWHFLTGTPFLTRIMAGLLKPKNQVLGIDVAGRVEAVGANVTQLKLGDEVFGSTTGGCFAEYVCASKDDLQLKPVCLSSEEAAAVVAAASTALRGLRDMGKLEAGQQVLVNGASGGVGTFAVQIAKAMGAEVTGVCSTRNMEMVSRIGADHVIDYTYEDFTQAEKHYDLVFDVAASLSFSGCSHILNQDGIYVTSEFSPPHLLKEMWVSMTGGRKFVPLAPKKPCKEDQVFLKQLLEEGKIKPVIDRCYLPHKLPDALRYLAKGHVRGKIIIRM